MGHQDRACASLRSSRQFFVRILIILLLMLTGGSGTCGERVAVSRRSPRGWKGCGQARRAGAPWGPVGSPWAGMQGPCMPVRAAQSMGFPRARAQSTGFPYPSTAHEKCGNAIREWNSLKPLSEEAPAPWTESASQRSVMGDQCRQVHRRDPIDHPTVARSCFQEPWQLQGGPVAASLMDQVPDVRRAQTTRSGTWIKGRSSPWWRGPITGKQLPIRDVRMVLGGGNVR